MEDGINCIRANGRKGVVSSRSQRWVRMVVRNILHLSLASSAKPESLSVTFALLVLRTELLEVGIGLQHTVSGTRLNRVRTALQGVTT
jgi:hypothetical protein